MSDEWTDDLLVVMAHSLLNVLAAVSADAQWLRTHGVGAVDVPEALDRMVERAAFAAETLKDLIRGAPPELIAVLDDLVRRHD